MLYPKQIIIQARRSGEKNWSVRSLCADINSAVANLKLTREQGIEAANNVMQSWMHNFLHDPAQLRVIEY
jgi:hypothetical protein